MDRTFLESFGTFKTQRSGKTTFGAFSAKDIKAVAGEMIADPATSAAQRALAETVLKDPKSVDKAAALVVAGVAPVEPKIPRILYAESESESGSDADSESEDSEDEEERLNEKRARARLRRHAAAKALWLTTAAPGAKFVIPSRWKDPWTGGDADLSEDEAPTAVSAVETPGEPTPAPMDPKILAGKRRRAADIRFEIAGDAYFAENSKILKRKDWVDTHMGDSDLSSDEASDDDSGPDTPEVDNDYEESDEEEGSESESDEEGGTILVDEAEEEEPETPVESDADGSDYGADESEEEGDQDDDGSGMESAGEEEPAPAAAARGRVKL